MTKSGSWQLSLLAFARHLHSKKGAGHRGGEPLSPKTIVNVVGVLAVLLNFAVKKKWLLASPMQAARTC